MWISARKANEHTRLAEQRTSFTSGQRHNDILSPHAPRRLKPTSTQMRLLAI
jgi:hypothetical protein